MIGLRTVAPCLCNAPASDSSSSGSYPGGGQRCAPGWMASSVRAPPRIRSRTGCVQTPAVFLCRWWLSVPWCMRRTTLLLYTLYTKAHRGALIYSQATSLSNAPITAINCLPSNTDFTSITSFRRALNGFNLSTYCDCWHLLYGFKRVYNCFYFLSYLLRLHFHGAALVALPCSCRWAALFHCLIAVSYLLFYLLCLFMYNKWNEILRLLLSHRRLQR